MNPRTYGSSIWLVAIGAASVLLIGAFTRFDTNRTDNNDQTNSAAPIVTGATAVVPTPSPSTVAASAPTLPADLSPGLGEVIKLAQAHVGDDVVLAYIQNSGQSYSPSASEILYLSDLGVSEKVIAALLKKPEAVATVPTPAAPADTSPALAPPATALAGAQDSMVEPPPEAMEEMPPLQNPQDSSFYSSLAPYGSWVLTDEYGWVWQPMAGSVDVSWAPYRDRGHWVFTDEGWYWASDYSWGWAAFHYGRWSQEGRFGWVWVPGNVWAPAWVAWRNTDSYSGWAPLPPGVYFRTGAGLVTAHGRAGVAASFGLGAVSFTFLSHEHFLSRNVARMAVPAASAAALFKTSTPVNNYSESGGKLQNVGVSVERIAAVTRAPVQKVTLRDVDSPDGAGGRLSGQGLAVYRPNLSATPQRSLASAPAEPMLINRDARATAPEGSTSFSARTPNAPGVRSGFNPNTFQPSHTAMATAPAPAAINPAYPNGAGIRRAAPVTETTPAPARGYSEAAPPSYAPRANYSAPAYSAPQYNAPQYNQYAPVQSRGGGTQVSGGGTSTSSSSNSKNQAPK